MKNTRMIVCRLLHPPAWVLFFIPTVGFAALAVIFAAQKTESTLAYPIYCMSAYSLSILVAAVPRLVRKCKQRLGRCRMFQRSTAASADGQQSNGLAFRWHVSIYHGMAVNFFYVIFRVAAGIRYASVWFISMAVYYLVLGGLRAYLIFCYRRRTPAREAACYRKTAWLLLLLNIPMVGMIVLMVRTNAGFSYPGYIIYLSAFYTFYSMISSVIHLSKCRKVGSPILSAARVLYYNKFMCKYHIIHYK